MFEIIADYQNLLKTETMNMWYSYYSMLFVRVSITETMNMWYSYYSMLFVRVSITETMNMWYSYYSMLFVRVSITESLIGVTSTYLADLHSYVCRSRAQC